MGPLIGKPGKPAFSLSFQCSSTVRSRIKSRKAAANRLRTMSLLGVPDFQAEWFRATPMAPYTHFHEFAFVRRSTYPQRHTIHHTCSLPCNFLPFCELLIRIVSPYQELICS